MMRTNRFVVMLTVFSYLLSLIAIPYLPEKWPLIGIRLVKRMGTVANGLGRLVSLSL